MGRVLQRYGLHILFREVLCKTHHKLKCNFCNSVKLSIVMPAGTPWFCKISLGNTLDDCTSNTLLRYLYYSLKYNVTL